MEFWCRQCQSTVGVTVIAWRVNVRGRASAGGQCGQCGDTVLWRIVKLSEAPPDVAAQAVLVEATYRYWERVRKDERDQHLRDIFMLLGRDDAMIDKIASAFGLTREWARLIIRRG